MAEKKTKATKVEPKVVATEVTEKVVKEPKSDMANEKLKATLTVLFSMVKNHENLNDVIIKNYKECMKELG